MQRRILLLLTDLEIGGTPTVVRELAIRLSAATSAHIQVAGLSTPGPLQDQLHKRQIPCTALGARSARDLPQIFPRLHRLLHNEKIDTLFSFLLHANALAAAVRPLHPRLRCFQSIQTTQPYPAWHWSLQRLIHHTAEKIIVPSQSVATVASNLSGIPAKKIAIIPNAIDPTDFPGGTGGPPVKTPPQPENFNLGFIGRLDPIKRIEDLIRALPLLPTNTHLHIYGHGAHRPVIESEINRLDLHNRITLHGAIPHPHDALQKIDLLILPSDAEGFGLVLIEAMAARIPVIATNVQGIRDVVTHNQTGLLVPARSPTHLSQAIQRLMDDPTLRTRLIQSAYEEVQARYTWQTILPAYMNLLNLAPKPASQFPTSHSSTMI